MNEVQSIDSGNKYHATLSKYDNEAIDICKRERTHMYILGTSYLLPKDVKFENISASYDSGMVIGLFKFRFTKYTVFAPWAFAKE